MSAVQNHGLAFEREVIRTCFGVSEEQMKTDPRFKAGAVFDIPLGVITAKHSGDPVSIKTTAMKAAAAVVATVCLSDASRVWAWAGPVVLVVGLYHQVGDSKAFHTVYELTFSLDDAQRRALYGALPAAEVEAFHGKLRSFPAGQHVQARAYAREERKRLDPLCGAIKLNPKIDSKTQRRLQCSARLVALLESGAQVHCATGCYRGLALPYRVQSPVRTFKKAKLAPSQNGALAPHADDTAPAKSPRCIP